MTPMLISITQKDHMLNAALQYAERGFSVIPLKGKKALTKWEQYQSRRATPDEIKSWWRGSPKANIGIITGSVSGLIVLDVDGPEGEKALAGRHLPQTCTATTGKGSHYFFQHPGGTVRNAVGLEPGLDFRGDGGYVVGAGSIHPSGRLYEWVSGLSPDDLEPADPPEWLLKKLSIEGSGKKVRPEEWESDVTQGERNNEITRRAGSLLARKLPVGETTEILLLWNHRHCQPPLAEDEVKRTVISVANRETNKPRAAFNLTKDKNGKVYSTIANALNILQNDELLKGRVALNEFSNQLEIKGKLPWMKERGSWADSDDAELRHYFETAYNYTGKGKIEDAFQMATTRAGFHPPREYFDGLKWDGGSRLDTLLVDYLGAEDNKYTRAVTRKTFTAAVTRVYRPGVKFDYMLVLIGGQGIGKTSLFRELAGDQWFTDDLRMDDMKSKTGPEKLPGKLIVEVGEMAGLRKTEVEEVKSFLSRQRDRYRNAYGRRANDHLRQCIIVGTTNASDGFLRDQTGNRRFWPIEVKQTALRAWDVAFERDQIWAEAKHRYIAGENLYLTAEVEQLAALVQKKHTEELPWMGLIEKYLKEKPIKKVCGVEIWVECLGGDKNRYGRNEQLEISNVLRKMTGWEQGKRERLPMYGRQRVFVAVK